MGRLVWEALCLVKAPLKGRGPLGSPVPDASLNTDTTLVVVDVSCELGDGRGTWTFLQEDLGLGRQALTILNRCQGNLSHGRAENALLKAWPHTRLSEGSNC